MSLPPSTDQPRLIIIVCTFKELSSGWRWCDDGHESFDLAQGRRQLTASNAMLQLVWNNGVWFRAFVIMFLTTGLQGKLKESFGLDSSHYLHDVVVCF